MPVIHIPGSNISSATFLSGGADPIDADNLRAEGVPNNYVLVSDGGGWKVVASQSVGTPPGAPGAHASSHVSGGADPVDVHLLRTNTLGSGILFSADGIGGLSTIHSGVFTLTSTFQTHTATILAASESFRVISASYIAVSASYNVISASYISVSGAFRNFSASHGSRHLSGAADAINAQDLGGATIAINRLLISNGLGGWTTVLSESVGAPAGAPGAHATTHISGGTDPIDIQLLRTNTLAAGFMFSSNGVGGLSTIHSGVFTLTSSFQAHSATILEASESFRIISASYTAVSASYNTLSATYYPVSASYNITSASYMAISASYDIISASYISVSGAFRNFSASHGSRHLSGAADAINAQDLGGATIAVNRLLISNGLGGWTTVLSESVGTPPGAPAAHATTHISGGTDPIDIQLLRTNALASGFMFSSNGVGGLSTIHSGVFTLTSSFQAHSATMLEASESFRVISASYIAVSASYNTLSATYYPVSASYNTLSSTYYPVSASYNTVSASYIAVSASYNTVSASYMAVSASFNRVSASFIGFSGSHGTRHLSGAADAINAQDLGGATIAVNRLLISNGLGGWTTVLSESVGAPPGAPGAHASSHLSGASDQISAQLLAANGLETNLLLITNANGGWTTVASQSVGGAGGGISTVLSATHSGSTIISGVVGSTLYLKQLISQTSSYQNNELGQFVARSAPIALSQTVQGVFFRQRPPTEYNRFFDDFLYGAMTAVGFGWMFTVGGTGASVQIGSVDSSVVRTNAQGAAIGVLEMDTGTTAAGGGTLYGGIGSFAIGFLSQSSLEWRLAITGNTVAGTQEKRIMIGWGDSILSGVVVNPNGLYFEFSATNANWNIVSTSGSVVTRYTTSQAINSASYQRYKIVTENNQGGTTASFYYNDALVGSISSTMPDRIKPVGPMVKIAKNIGTTQHDLFVDWCEIFYTINR